MIIAADLAVLGSNHTDIQFQLLSLMAKRIQALKAVSQNLMHSNLSITDGVYGILSEMDVKEQIINLGLKIAKGEITELSELITLTKHIEELLKDYKLS